MNTAGMQFGIFDLDNIIKVRKTELKVLPFSEKMRFCLLLILIVSVVFACFFPTLNNGFVWDDHKNFIENFNYRGLSLSHLSWMFTTFHDANYHPLAWLTLGADFVLWGMNPAGYHLTNLVLHTLNAVLFYIMVVAFLQGKTTATHKSNTLSLRTGAAVGALFFALHPLRVEPVAIVSSRADVLCGFFYLLTVIAYLRMNDSETAVHRQRWLLLALLFFIFSLLSRAWGITLPLVLLILDVYPLRRFDVRPEAMASCKKVLLEKIPFAFLALGAGILAFRAKRTSMLIVETYGIMDRLAQAAYGLCFYVVKTIAPTRLSPLYLLEKNFNPLEPKYVLAALSVFGVTLGLIAMRRRWPWALTAWMCYAVIVSPLLGFVQSGPQIAADRYTYIACMPFGVLAGAGVYRLWVVWQRNSLFKLRWIPFMILITSGLLVLAFISFRQTRVFSDDFTFWSHVLRLDPENYIAFNNRGFFCKEQRDLSDTLNDYNNAIRIKPEYTPAYFNRGNLRQDLDDLEGALQDYNTAIRLGSNHESTYYNRAILLKKNGDLTGALRDFNAAIRINPWHWKAYNNRGLLRKEQGDFAGADKDFTASLRLNPSRPEIYCNRGLNRLSQNNYKAALTDFTKALEVAPENWPDRGQIAKILHKIRLKLKQQG